MSPFQGNKNSISLQGTGQAGLLAAPSKVGSLLTSGLLGSDTIPLWAQHPPGTASRLACETRGQGRQHEHGAHVACFAWSNTSFVFVPEVSCLLPASLGLASWLPACEWSRTQTPLSLVPRLVAVHGLALTPLLLGGGDTRSCMACGEGP